MRSVMATVLGLIIGLIFLNLSATGIDDATTNQITQVTSVTAAADGSGTMTLNNINYFTDRTSMTVTGATDGALNNASTTVDAARTGLTFLAGALTGSSTQNVTVVHLTEDTASSATNFIQIVPFLFVMGILTATVFGGVTGFKGGGGGAGVDIKAMLAVVIGLFLIGVIADFVDDTEALYNVRPEYIGVVTVMPLVLIGYAIGLVGNLIGGGRSLIGK